MQVLNNRVSNYSVVLPPLPCPAPPTTGLDLSSNQLGAGGVSQIAKALAKAPRLRLRELDVSDNDIGVGGAQRPRVLINPRGSRFVMTLKKIQIIQVC